jgi:type I restriction-modification system DNA methylase subunit
MDEFKNLEKTLWAAADKLCSNMDAAEYKHVVLGLIFLKYISDDSRLCKAATMDEVRNNNYVLMPGRYVGTEEDEDDGILFADKIALTTKLAEQLSKGHTLETEIRENLKSIGYEF